MRILVDSNVLLRTAKPDDPAYQTSLNALLQLKQNQHVLTIVPQCAYEFYVVATRPILQNGLGLEPREAIDDIVALLKIYEILPDNPTIFDLWKTLLDKHQVRGKTAHDARLVAAMQAHQIEGLLTFNLADFQRYEPDIRVIDPAVWQMKQ